MVWGDIPCFVYPAKQLFFFYWVIGDLQHVNFCCTAKWLSYLCCCCCCVASVVSNSVRPHRWQPTRLRRPWDSPGKNTGVGCHFLLQCMKVKSEREVAQSCLTLSNPMECSPPGSSVHRIFQARVLEWGPLPSPKLSMCTRIYTFCFSVIFYYGLS